MRDARLRYWAEKIICPCQYALIVLVFAVLTKFDLTKARSKVIAALGYRSVEPWNDMSSAALPALPGVSLADALTQSPGLSWFACGRVVPEKSLSIKSDGPTGVDLKFLQKALML